MMGNVPLKNMKGDGRTAIASSFSLGPDMKKAYREVPFIPILGLKLILIR